MANTFVEGCAAEPRVDLSELGTAQNEESFNHLHVTACPRSGQSCGFKYTTKNPRPGTNRALLKKVSCISDICPLHEQVEANAI